LLHLTQGFSNWGSGPFGVIFSIPLSSRLQAIRPVLSQANLHRQNKHEEPYKELPGLLHSTRKQNMNAKIVQGLNKDGGYSIKRQIAPILAKSC
uniref:Uncharacterized protein n=1 Tax=Chrysemys picta bellii TaxID=8478 RepID=A0A8C3F665_CHRPI